LRRHRGDDGGMGERRAVHRLTLFRPRGHDRQQNRDVGGGRLRKRRFGPVEPSEGFGHRMLGSNYNERVVALRYVYVLALSLWFGGTIVIGAIAAPVSDVVLRRFFR